MELNPELEETQSVDEESDEGTGSEEEEEIEAAVKTREKRANAGNRMRALLEEEGLEADEMFEEEEGDQDFEAKDEEDIFDSDFGSTDSGEGEDEGEDAEERKLEREAKTATRDARGKKKKTTHTPFLPSFARHTKQSQKPPVASTSAATLDDTTPEAPPPPKRRKISLANAIAGMTPRESSRKSAVAFKKTIEVRLLESEQKRASIPKPVKKATIALTQADLIAEALETEEINRASLLAFYAAEEDRRAADRIAGMRYEIYGPKVTFLSRLEGVPRKDKGKEVATEEEQARSQADRLDSGRRRLIEVVGEYGKQGWKPPIVAVEDATIGAAARGETAPTSSQFLPVGAPSTPLASLPPKASNTDIFDNFEQTGPSSSQAVAEFLLPPPTSPDLPAPSSPFSSPLRPSTSNIALPAELPVSLPSPSTSTLLPPLSSVPLKLPEPIPIENTAPKSPPAEPHSRNYLILSEVEETAAEEMSALFGDHHEWGSVKVVPSRSRVLTRKVPSCVITGLPALYRDPRTLAPYASVAAYQTLTRVIKQAYVWNDTLGAFTGTSGVGLQKEIERATGTSPTKVNGTGASKGKARASSTTDLSNPYAQPYAARIPRKERATEADLINPSTPQLPPPVPSSDPALPTVSSPTLVNGNGHANGTVAPPLPPPPPPPPPSQPMGRSISSSFSPSFSVTITAKPKPKPKSAVMVKSKLSAQTTTTDAAVVVPVQNGEEVKLVEATSNGGPTGS